MKKKKNINTNKRPNPKSKKEKISQNNLFYGLTFFLNRETPQLSLEFVILSLGGQVIFEQDCKNDEERDDTRITHQIVDRTIEENTKLATREYIQPQWVYDCLNCGCFVPVEHYQPGVQCPPHLSPFVNYDEHHHKPSQAFVIEHWQELAKEYKGHVPPAKSLEKRKSTNNEVIKNDTHNEIQEEAQKETGIENWDLDDDLVTNNNHNEDNNTNINDNTQENEKKKMKIRPSHS